MYIRSCEVSEDLDLSAYLLSLISLRVPKDPDDFQLDKEFAVQTGLNYLRTHISKGILFLVLAYTLFSEKEMHEKGFPAYITSCGWIGFSDEKIVKVLHVFYFHTGLC